MGDNHRYIKIRAFNIEILLMLIDHRILWNGNTDVIFGQIQSKKSNIYSPRHFRSSYKVIFGHLYSVKLTDLETGAQK